MTSEQNKVIARRFREDIWTSDGFAKIHEIVDPECVLHVEDAMTPRCCAGPAGLAMIVSGFKSGFPDAVMTVHEMVAEGDQVAVLWSATGTHTGEIWGVAPTNKQLTTSGIDWLRIVDGKIVEARSKWDTLGVLGQMGAVPLPTAPVGGP